MSTIDAAVVGCGHMGALHAAKLAAMSGVNVVAVVDADLARAQALASKLGCEAHGDAAALPSRVQAAVVAVPTEAHANVAQLCLARGMHVLVEKPIATSVDEARTLVAHAAREQRLLQVAHIERFNPAYRSIAARIDRPMFIDAERLASFKLRGIDVDVVLDLMIHDLDLALTLVGRDVQSVSAIGFGVLTNGIDIANAYVEFDNGCIANLSASRVSQQPSRKYRVFQHNVYLSADLHAGRLRAVHQRDGRIDQADESFEAADALALQDEAFIQALRGERPVAVTGDDGARALALALDVGRLARERLQRFDEGAPPR
jgi:predicted dehydrogenase